MRIEDLYLSVAGQRLECRWYRPDSASATSGTAADTSLVFLHEGLGCVALWRDYPAELAEATGLPAFVYSRRGYGGSDPCELPRPLAYMHDEGLEVLGPLLAAAGIGRHILIGHSDGASIAIVYAGGTPADGLAGMVLEAPHVNTEPGNVAAIARICERYEQGDLRERLARYHGANVDCAFRGWSQAWRDPGFLDWNIETYLPAIGVPSLVIQGLEDAYGTPAQCEAVQAQVSGPCELLLLEDCQHAPHFEQHDRVLEAMTAFVAATA